MSGQRAFKLYKKRKEGMTRDERNALLSFCRLSRAEIARETRRSVSTVITVVNYYPRKKSRPIQECIAKRVAERTNISYEDIWGRNESKRNR